MACHGPNDTTRTVVEVVKKIMKSCHLMKNTIFQSLRCDLVSNF